MTTLAAKTLKSAKIEIDNGHYAKRSNAIGRVLAGTFGPYPETDVEAIRKASEANRRDAELLDYPTARGTIQFGNWRSVPVSERIGPVKV